MNISTNVIKQMRVKLPQKVSYVVRVVFSQKYLFYTNVTISAALSGLGDILEQNYEIIHGKVDKWDKLRTLRMTLSGITVGIVCHHWYSFLDRRLPGYTISLVMKKIVIDQLVGSPICISTFFGTLAVLERTPYKEFLLTIKKKAWRLYAAEWVIWPPAQFINFYFLPHKYRVLYDSTISLGYDVYTSYVVHEHFED